MLIGQSGQQCKPHIITLSRSSFNIIHSAMVYHPNEFETVVTLGQNEPLYCTVPDSLARARLRWSGPNISSALPVNCEYDLYDLYDL